jgi:hypothetical protein
MDDEPVRRIGANEALYRQVNESINRGRWPGEDEIAIGFRCECAEIGCNSLISLTREEYEDVRAHPRRFLVLPGHELRFIESVVATRPGYVVVEKRDQAGLTAEDTDPRS